MKALFPMLVCAVALTSTSCSNRKTVEREEFGMLVKFEVDKETGEKDGNYTKTELDGTLIEEATYTNGKLTGTRTIYYANGNPEIVEQYRDDILHGTFRSYYENADLEIEGDYIEGSMQGKWKRYYQGGQLMEEVMFADNEENGPFTEYHKNGSLKAEGNYLNGDNEHGLLKLYNEEGELVRKMQCDSGICQTTWVSPDLNEDADD